MSTTYAFLPVLAGEDDEGLMPQAAGVRKSEARRASWTPDADADLRLVVNDPAVRDQLKCNAEAILHEIEASADGDRSGEGFAGEVMWHRGWTREQERRASWHQEQADDGPWNYVLFYRSADVPAKFVVLAVRSNLQIADWIWQQMQNGRLTRGRCLDSSGTAHEPIGFFGSGASAGLYAWSALRFVVANARARHGSRSSGAPG
jgi:hypothetical protein